MGNGVEDMPRSIKKPYPNFSLEGLRKTAKNLSHDTQFLNLQNSGTTILIFNTKLVIATYKVNPLPAVAELVNYQMITESKPGGTYKRKTINSNVSF
jgi:hypothetical protein